MTARIARWLLTTAAVLAVSATSAALSLVPRSDNTVSAWGARTGEPIWTNAPEALTDAWFEMFPDTLSVHGTVYPDSGPTYDVDFYLARDTGVPGSAPESSEPIGRSDSHWPMAPVVLDNSWKLAGFDSGYDQVLVFEDASGAVMWQLDTGTYPHEVHAWRNTVFWAESPSDDGIVHAHEALAAAEAWQFDPNALVSAAERLTRPYLRVIDDDLYVGVNEHLFQVDPLDGSSRRQWDLVALTGLPWEAEFDAPGFFSGGLNLGSFTADTETLVVGFERRVVAVDRETGDLLWHRDPESFPGRQQPLLHGGTLHLLTGSQAAPHADADAGDDDTGCGCRAAGSARSHAPSTVSLWALIVVVCRRRRATDRPDTRRSPRCR